LSDVNIRGGGTMEVWGYRPPGVKVGSKPPPPLNLVPRAFCFRSAKMALASAGHMISKSPVFEVFNYDNLCMSISTYIELYTF
jgi:hypothetical protein